MICKWIKSLMEKWIKRSLNVCETCGEPTQGECDLCNAERRFLI